MNKKRGLMTGRYEVLLYIIIATADFVTNAGALYSIKEGHVQNKTFFYIVRCTIKSGRTTLM
jgi:hypothetical protein